MRGNIDNTYLFNIQSCIFNIKPYCIWKYKWYLLWKVRHNVISVILLTYLHSFYFLLVKEFVIKYQKEASLDSISIKSFSIKYCFNSLNQWLVAYGWQILPDDSWYNKFPLEFLLPFCQNVRVITKTESMCAKCPIIILPDPFSPFHFGNLIRVGYIYVLRIHMLNICAGSETSRAWHINDPRDWLKISAHGMKPHNLVLSHTLPHLKMQTEEGKDWVWFFTWV